MLSRLLLYLAATAMLILYLLLAGNEYAWMQDLQAQLPEDPDQRFKQILFGIPAGILSLLACQRSFVNGRLLSRLFAVSFGLGAMGILLFAH